MKKTYKSPNIVCADERNFLPVLAAAFTRGLALGASVAATKKVFGDKCYAKKQCIPVLVTK